MPPSIKIYNAIFAKKRKLTLMYGDMGAIGGQFTWPLEAEIWAPLAVNLFGLWKRKFEHQWQSSYLLDHWCSTYWIFFIKNMNTTWGQFTWPLEIKNMDAIGSQFTFLLQGAIFTYETMLTCSSIMCGWLNCVIIVHVVIEWLTTAIIFELIYYINGYF